VRNARRQEPELPAALLQRAFAQLRGQRWPATLADALAASPYRGLVLGLARAWQRLALANASAAAPARTRLTAAPQPPSRGASHKPFDARKAAANDHEDE
jgi:hypothetical protein